MRQFLCQCGAFALCLSRSLAAEPEVDAAQLPRVPPTPPEQALATFKIKPGFRLELVAAEPLVIDPVAMSFDEDGRLYVVEMRDYSERRPERLGRIRRLEDLDGDGRFEKSTVFADGLPWPTAVTCWAGGIFVGATPDILWMKDTNGDGVADEREIVFTGFAADYAPFETNKLNVQALMNSFQWSLDNRIQGATSFSGGKVKLVDSPFVREWLKRAGVSPSPGGEGPGEGGANPSRGANSRSQLSTFNTPLDLRGRDFSFDPRTLEMRAESGGGQHGMTFDNHGRKFICSNSDHIQQIVYEDRYAARNPYYTMPSPRVSVAADGPAAEVFRISPDEPWRVLRTQWRVAGLVSGPVEGGGRASGYFTGATGLTIYRGDAYGEGFVGDAFIGDAGGNLVHRKKLRPDGIVFRAERPAEEQKVEFLASTDTWFRPVQFANGPDGCLYIADMYREVIEHPWSLPANLKKHLDLNSGNDRGRIYRIVPENFQRRSTLRLSEASPAELVKVLEHRNGWHRDTASRLIYERQDTNADTALRQLKLDDSSLTEIHALHCLVGLGTLALGDLQGGGLDYSKPGVAIHALRVAEEASFLGDPSMQGFIDRILQITSPEVQFQSALSLGTFQSKYRDHWVAVLAHSSRSNNWVQAAVVNAAGERSTALFMSLANGMNWDRRVSQRWQRRETLEAASRGDLWAYLDDLARLVGATARTSQLQSAAIEITRLRSDPRGLRVAAHFLEGLREAKRSFQSEGLTGTLNRWFDEAARAVVDVSKPVELRAGSVQLVGLSGSNSPPPLLYSLLDVTQPKEVQAAALAEIGRFGGVEPAQHLINRWSAFSPGQRSAAVELLLRRPERVSVLLSALERGVVRPKEFSAAQLQFLRTHTDRSIREHASKALGQPASSSRDQVVSSFLPALKLNGVASEGRKIFASRCGACHKRGEEGRLYGVDLRTVKDSGKEKLLTNILDPNREVAPNYFSYFVDTKAGESLTGIITRETAASVTLRQANGDEIELNRAHITSIYSSGRSLMPEGLEVGLKPQDMADLLEFIVRGP